MHLLFTAGYSFCTSARKYWAFSARLCEDIIGGADSLFCFSEDIYKKKKNHKTIRNASEFAELTNQREKSFTSASTSSSIAANLR
jgi:predicted house-cleaning NTP pyrophosphatase (Maf/HAM1 superfamily)